MPRKHRLGKIVVRIARAIMPFHCRFDPLKRINVLVIGQRAAHAAQTLTGNRIVRAMPCHWHRAMPCHRATIAIARRGLAPLKDMMIRWGEP